MKILPSNRGRRIAAAIVAALGAAAIGSAIAPQPAHADPAWGSESHPLVAVGSNTIEDLLDAYSGVAPTPGLGQSNYHTFQILSDPSTGISVYSWDAANQNGVGQGDCISPKPGAAPIARPNGSGDGAKALSAAIANEPWSKSTSSGGCAAQSPAGDIDIARSSSPPSNGACSSGGNCMTYIDIAHDAVSYAFYIKPGSGVTASQVDSLTNSQLTNIYENANGNGLWTDSSTGITYMDCLPQLGSGTEAFFLGSLNGGSGFSKTQVTAAESGATNDDCAGFEENGATTFESQAATAYAQSANSSAEVAVTPFSVGSWIAQDNGYAFDRSSTGIADGVQLGTIDGLGSSPPYSGTAPNIAPSGTFEASTLYGRELYLVVNNASINGTITSNVKAERDLFGYQGNNVITEGPTNPVNTPLVCTAPWGGSGTTELTDFGFEPAQYGRSAGLSCGNETIVAINSGTSQVGS